MTSLMTSQSPKNMVENNPLDTENIKEKQDTDEETQLLLRKYPQ
jgi:hypothetical protein